MSKKTTGQTKSINELEDLVELYRSTLHTIWVVEDTFKTLQSLNLKKDAQLTVIWDNLLALAKKEVEVAPLIESLRQAGISEPEGD